MRQAPVGWDSFVIPSERGQHVDEYIKEISDGFLPVSIAKENRLDYYNALEAYALQGELEQFADLVAELEEDQLDTYIKLIET